MWQAAVESDGTEVVSDDATDECAGERDDDRDRGAETQDWSHGQVSAERTSEDQPADEREERDHAEPETGQETTTDRRLRERHERATEDEPAPVDRRQRQADETADRDEKPPVTLGAPERRERTAVGHCDPPWNRTATPPLAERENCLYSPFAQASSWSA